MSKRGFATFSKPLGALSASAAKKPRLSSPTAGVDAAIAAGNNGGDAASCSSSSSNSAAPLAANSLDNFDLSAYIASLSTEPLPGSDLSERQLLALECATLDPSWLAVLQDEIRKPYFIKLKQALWKEGVRGVQDSLKKTAVPVFPPAQDLYSWSRYTPLKSVRVCISGQDPYHGAGEGAERMRLLAELTMRSLLRTSSRCACGVRCSFHALIFTFYHRTGLFSSTWRKDPAFLAQHLQRNLGRIRQFQAAQARQSHFLGW